MYQGKDRRGGCRWPCGASWWQLISGAGAEAQPEALPPLERLSVVGIDLLPNPAPQLHQAGELLVSQTRNHPGGDVGDGVFVSRRGGPSTTTSSSGSARMPSMTVEGLTKSCVCTGSSVGTPVTSKNGSEVEGQQSQQAGVVGGDGEGVNRPCGSVHEVPWCEQGRRLRTTTCHPLRAAEQCFPMSGGPSHRKQPSLDEPCLLVGFSELGVVALNAAAETRSLSGL